MPRPLVEISDATIDALLARPEVVAALPALFEGLLAARQRAARACPKCPAGQRAKATLRLQYDRVKLAMVAMPAESLATLKRLLDAEKIRVLAGRNHAGTPVRHTL